MIHNTECFCEIWALCVSWITMTTYIVHIAWLAEHSLVHWYQQCITFPNLPKLFSWEHIYYAHPASVRFEHSVCRGSILCSYIYIYIYIYIWTQNWSTIKDSYILIHIYKYIHTYIYTSIYETICNMVNWWHWSVIKILFPSLDCRLNVCYNHLVAVQIPACKQKFENETHKETKCRNS